MGIRTSRCEDLESLDFEHVSLRQANRYEPTPEDVLEDMFLELDLEPKERVFVDLGSGKGRASFYASAYPFKKIIGVEFVPKFHEIAQANLREFSASWRECEDIEFILKDATDYLFPEEPLVLYMFNPFQEKVLAKVIENLEISLKQLPRPVYVLYYMPDYAFVLEESPRFTLVKRSLNWQIYQA